MKIKESGSALTRKERLLAEGAKFAKSHGYRTMTILDITRAAGVSYSVVNLYFGSIKKFKRAIMKYAIEIEDLDILAEGLTAKDGSLGIIPPDLRRRAAVHLLSKHK